MGLGSGLDEVASMSLITPLLQKQLVLCYVLHIWQREIRESEGMGGAAGWKVCH